MWDVIGLREAGRNGFSTVKIPSPDPSIQHCLRIENSRIRDRAAVDETVERSAAAALWDEVKDRPRRKRPPPSVGEDNNSAFASPGPLPPPPDSPHG